MVHSRNSLSVVILFASQLLLHRHISLCKASVACTSNTECQSVLRKGSICGDDGFCTNPFHYGGCLQNYLPDWKRTRICGSDDPPEALQNSHCILPPLDYMEIRISSENWESVFFQAWIMQIILTEMLDVPASIETGKANLNIDFYNAKSSMDYGTSSDWDALRRATKIGDCRKLKVGSKEEDAEEAYQSCHHVNPEVWNSDLSDALEMREKNEIEAPQEMGALGEQHWFMPKFTALKYPSLVSYTGLQGKSNRRKLAELFKRPTTWKTYCDIISVDNCKTSDDVASRAPLENEDGKMFAEGLYTGYFRATKFDNCTQNPTTCTGHIADWPCGWLSFVGPLTHHLGIALKSNGYEANGGYTYSQLTQIWAAANATKSNVIMEWWSPDALYQQYMGTDAEFTKVVLPPPTQTCIDSRILRDDRCGDDFNLRVGDPKGACDYAPKVLTKLIAGSLYDSTFDPSIPESLWSPGYDAVKNFRISDLQLSKILEDWLGRGTDKYGFDARDATCRWVVENLDFVQSFMPRTYPRVVEEEDISTILVFKLAYSFAVLAIILVVISAVITYIKRNQRVIRLAPRDFLFLILFGLFLIALNGLLLALPPTNGICVARIWLGNIGCTIELVTIVTKMSAIHRLVATGKGMQHVRLGARRLYGTVLIFSCMLGVILLAWTLMDIPHTEVDYELSENQASNDETIIIARSHCGSESEYWSIFSIAWNSVLLLSATVLAFLARGVKDDMNDSRSLSMLIYSLFFFAGLRITLDLVNGAMHQSQHVAYISLIFSADCIAAIAIYFLPILFEKSAMVYDSSEQLPDLFLRTTIMFADVVGFTAWSSMRDPAQVFKFLETVYGSFDDIAERRKVFKVETVADCYVAATGLPKPRSDHAVVMAKFASDCLEKMNRLTKELDVLYGPDTGELSLRIGIHSGPVTGGYLKGKGARFQLFGDTMNTTSRIESSSESGRIHLSEATANLLISAGKGRWVKKRDGKVQTKGKGELQTYWLSIVKHNHQHNSTATSFSTSSVGESSNHTRDYEHPRGLAAQGKDRTSRLIDFNVEVLLKLLKQIVARRNFIPNKGSEHFDTTNTTTTKNGIPLEEVKAIITLPKFDRRAAKRHRNVDEIEIPSVVVNQLKLYVTCIASRYPDNAFHNFDHASHVVTSVIKLMNRIVAPTDIDLGSDDDKHYSKSAAAATLHDHTYGITSDPLTQFACLYSALIHDVDHPGVPNPRLIVEDANLAAKYKGRSVAEQNSFDIAWELLMEGRFREFLTALCCDSMELSRFRQLVINSVMATDLGDKDLKALRNARWDKAFHIGQEETPLVEESASDDVNRKATIVIEHLIQASDVAHTMQHWHVYRKWNQKLFMEMYNAFSQGRSNKNPADYWYDGELGFFDFYIVPLAKKLDECGVFGVSSDENLNYATQNRAEWQERGREVVAQMLQIVQSGVIMEEGRDFYVENQGRRSTLLLDDIIPIDDEDDL